MEAVTFVGKTALSTLANMTGEDGKIKRDAFDAVLAALMGSAKQRDDTLHALCLAAIRNSLSADMGGNGCPSLALKIAKGAAANMRSVRLQGMVAWFAAYSNIRLKVEQKGGKKIITGGLLKKDKDKAHRTITPALIEKAEVTPFWAAKESKVSPKAYDDSAVYNDLMAAIRHHKKAKEEGRSNLTAKGEKALTEILALAADLEPAK